jgi:nucleoside-diphosphate-sugar epimerase
MRIFVTGASGCIGHYVIEELIQQTDCELFLLVRNPNKLQFDCQLRPGVTILQGDMQAIEQYGELLKTIDVAILIATSWGGAAESFEINVVKTIRLIDLLDLQVCQQIIYFSTASILDRNDNLLKEAGELGTDYIRTKYECHSRLLKHAIAHKITTIFPTLVVGGEPNKPYSHFFAGLPDVIKWIGLIRWLKADGSFHFIHARDVAQIVKYLVENPTAELSSRKFVLGNQLTTVNEAIEEICAYLNKKIYLRIPLSIWLANFLIVIFNIKVEAWDRFCFVNHRHFTYKNIVTPATFGLSNYCSTLTDVLKLRGIIPKKIK